VSSRRPTSPCNPLCILLPLWVLSAAQLVSAQVPAPAADGGTPDAGTAARSDAAAPQPRAATEPGALMPQPPSAAPEQTPINAVPVPGPAQTSETPASAASAAAPPSAADASAPTAAVTPGAAAAAGGYRAKARKSRLGPDEIEPYGTGSRLDIPLEELPATVNLIDHRTLEERGVLSVDQALGFIPGMMATWQYGGFLNLSMRGFQALTLNDGNRDTRAVIADSAPQTGVLDLDRIEVLRGRLRFYTDMAR
jgi:iron complex outermembrane receptor protein